MSNGVEMTRLKKHAIAILLILRDLGIGVMALVALTALALLGHWLSGTFFFSAGSPITDLPSKFISDIREEGPALIFVYLWGFFVSATVGFFAMALPSVIFFVILGRYISYLESYDAKDGGGDTLKETEVEE